MKFCVLTFNEFCSIIILSLRIMVFTSINMIKFEAKNFNRHNRRCTVDPRSRLLKSFTELRPHGGLSRVDLQKLVWKKPGKTPTAKPFAWGSQSPFLDIRTRLMWNKLCPCWIDMMLVSDFSLPAKLHVLEDIGMIYYGNAVSIAAVSFLASTAPFHCSHFGRPVVGISHEHLRKRARGFHSGMKPCYIWITALWAVNAAVPRSTPTLTWFFVVLVTAHLFVLNVFWFWNVEYILNNSGLITEYVRWSTLSEQLLRLWDMTWYDYTYDYHLDS